MSEHNIDNAVVQLEAVIYGLLRYRLTHPIREVQFANWCSQLKVVVLGAKTQEANPQVRQARYLQ
jgi:hypothetical protein